MTVNAEWAQRNLGLHIQNLNPRADETAVGAQPDQSISRELIDYDSQGASGAAFKSRAPLAALGLSHYVDIPWPQGLTPKVGSKPV